MIYPNKYNFTQLVNAKKIPNELESSKYDYYRTFLISKDEDLELHLKRKPNLCFVNNYFDVGLKHKSSRGKSSGKHLKINQIRPVNISKIS